MNSLKTHIAQAFLLTFLVVFGLEMVTSSFSSQSWQNFQVSEMPFDAEEEGEKLEKDKEWSGKVNFYNDFRVDELISTISKSPHLNRYSSIPREIVTPPPESCCCA